MTKEELMAKLAELERDTERVRSENTPLDMGIVANRLKTMGELLSMEAADRDDALVELMSIVMRLVCEVQRLRELVDG